MMTAGPIRISIIIVNYNGLRFLKGCLDSVLPQCDAATEVIVVDNGSRDGSAEFLAAEYPSVRLLRSDVNLGFAGGNNFGVRAANGELIILLNNDTVVRDGWLRGLVAAIADAGTGAATSLIRTEGIPDRYYERNGSVNLLGHNIMRVFDDPKDIFFPGGASMIFRKSVLGEPFDDDYFVYAEDVYCGLRCRFAGLAVRHTNDSVVDHFGGGTSKSAPSPFLTYHQERNRLLNLFLFFSPATILRSVPYLLVNIIAKFAACLLVRKYSFHGLLKAYLWFPGNIAAIRRKRKELRTEKKVPDSEVLRAMSGKLTSGESMPGRIINTVALVYCRIVRLPVIEVTQ